ncbi:MAG: hypothetical protein GY738_06140 [Pseudoalteromonas sp.]|nr:hypothetical protein [Pseudoalteromonas sp.]
MSFYISLKMVGPVVNLLLLLLLPGPPKADAAQCEWDKASRSLLCKGGGPVVLPKWHRQARTLIVKCAPEAGGLPSPAELNKISRPYQLVSRRVRPWYCT